MIQKATSSNKTSSNGKSSLLTSESQSHSSLAAKDFKVVMVGPSTKEKGGMGVVQKIILKQKYRNYHIDHISTWEVYQRADLQFVKALISLVYKLLTNQVDLLHIHISERGSVLRKSIVALLGFVFFKPVIMHCHGCEFHLFHKKLPWLLQKLLNKIFQKCSYVIVLSQSWRDFYVSQCALKLSQVKVLYNPIEIPKTSPRFFNPSQITLVYLGKINQRKGIDDLLQALALIVSEDQLRSKIQLVIAGNGRIEEALDLARELNIDDLVQFPGWINSQQRNKLLAQGDIFILPSYNEGLPMALLEAMSWGLPVVTTPVGGIPELVINDETGLLVGTGNIKHLSSAIRFLIEDDYRRLRLGNAARTCVQSLDIENYKHKLSKLYCSAIAKQ